MDNQIDTINNKTQIQIDLEIICSRINDIYSEDITMPKEILLLIIQMAEEREILRKYLQRLCDNILKEFDKDGYCTLAISKEKAIKMNEMLDDMLEVEELNITNESGRSDF